MRIGLSVFLWVVVVIAAQAQTLHSPNRKLTLRFALSPSGEPTYQLRYGAKPVVQPSRLAVLLKDAPGFAQGFAVARVDSSRHDATIRTG